jgi:hypothetical protein
LGVGFGFSCSGPQLMVMTCLPLLGFCADSPPYRPGHQTLPIMAVQIRDTSAPFETIPGLSKQNRCVRYPGLASVPDAEKSASTRHPSGPLRQTIR